jgi:hypothetical protein
MDELYDCAFCKGYHSYEAPCEVRDSAFARLKARRDELRKQSLEEPREWPPKGKVIKEWEVYGMKCAVAWGTLSMCGYVCVPKTHPNANNVYDDVRVDVHGGLTYNHRALDGGMWFGFDTAHYMDWISYPSPVGEHPGKIWTVEDMVKETTYLAAQLAGVKIPYEDV